MLVWGYALEGASLSASEPRDGATPSRLKANSFDMLFS
jgi:hypothetical protein